MIQGDGTHTILCNYQEDFKAETIAAGIAEQGTDPEQIIILMLGALKRTFSNDIRDVSQEMPGDYKEYTILRTYREGIYDMLPESLFHLPTGHKSAKSEREIIKHMKRRRLEELNARKFFVPMEASINYLRVQMSMQENRLDKRTDYDDLVKLFAAQWKIFQYLDSRQANIFLHLLPIIHEIRDDHEKIREIMEMVFSIPVYIEMGRQYPLSPADGMFSLLDDSMVGVNLTTGNLQYDEGADEIRISLGPMEAAMYREFMPGRRNRLIYDHLCDYLLPVQVDIVSRFNMKPADQMARLGDESGFHNAVLGEDMVLM
ncbi:MAG TPA: type VI secretion system baseplate subunit TssG [Flavitalea sp.]|nr:type VI secretion system baseplate subunit TssG [Flavitalea sp.]